MLSREQTKERQCVATPPPILDAAAASVAAGIRASLYSWDVCTSASCLAIAASAPQRGRAGAGFVATTAT